MVSAKKLIWWFYYMYNNGWGYIFGKSGQLWTQRMQDRATNAMAKKYGEKWIGHYVTDCSGAFVFAFKKEGEKIYHGSDTIFKKYCSAKGKLNKGVRADGEPIKPGTAVFLLKDGKRHHIGLYVGNNLCIEAKGTIYGVVTSALSHWDEWGELKDVDYLDAFDGFDVVDMKSDSEGVTAVIAPVYDTRRTLRRGCRGNDVKWLQETLNKWNQNIELLAVDGIFGRKTQAAVRLFQSDKEIRVDGIVGPQTYAKLDEIK